jgi:hypothetical protein
MASTPPPGHAPEQPAAGLQELELPGGKKYTVGAVNKAFSETKLEASLAQVLFVPWYEEVLSEVNGGEVPMPKVQAGIDKAFRIAEEFRKKMVHVEFDKRETYDKAERDKYRSGGKTLIHLPDAGVVAPLVPGGYIQGLNE